MRIMKIGLRVGFIALMLTAPLTAPAWAAESDASAHRHMGEAKKMRHKQVNVNTASARQIAKRLARVGIIKARRIVAYRDQNGPFASVDELLKVRGISRKILARNKRSIALK